MSSDNALFSDDSFDTYFLDFHTGKDIKNDGILRRDWEAIEQHLYNDGGSELYLNSRITHECRLWRETFPHLRVRGRQINNPYRVRREKIKHQVISHMVDSIVDRIDGGALNIGKDKCVQHKYSKTQESYYERGKGMDADLDSAVGTLDKLKSGSTLESSTSVSPREDILKKAIPRSILKNSSTRKPKHTKAHDRRRSKDSTSIASFRNTSLPRISPTRNNWLIRAEQHSEQPPPSRRSSHNYPKPRKYHQDRRRDSQVFLPPLSTPNGTKI